MSWSPYVNILIYRLAHWKTASRFNLSLHILKDRMRYQKCKEDLHFFEIIGLHSTKHFILNLLEEIDLRKDHARFLWGGLRKTTWNLYGHRLKIQLEKLCRYQVLSTIFANWAQFLLQGLLKVKLMIYTINQPHLGNFRNMISVLRIDSNAKFARHILRFYTKL